MAEAATPVRINAHRMHHLMDLVPHLYRRPVRMVEPDRLLQGLLDGHAGVQGGVGVLEDHLHLATVRQRILTLEMIDTLTVVVDLAGAGRQQAHHGSGHGRLATAGFAHHAQGLALLHFQIHAIDSVHGFLFAAETATLEGDLLQQAAGQVKAFLKTADTYQRGGHDSASCMRFSCSIRLATS